MPRHLRQLCLPLCVAILAIAAQSAPAQNWEPLLDEQKAQAGDTEGWGNVYGRQVKRLGRDFIEFKVTTKTKVSGRGNSGRSFATFAVVGKDKKPIVTLQAAKYASTGIDAHKTQEAEETVSVAADTFWADFDADKAQFVLNVACKEKIDFPTSTKSAVTWYHDNIAPALADGVDLLRGKAIGELLKGDGWIAKNVKKGSLK